MELISLKISNKSSWNVSRACNGNRVLGWGQRPPQEKSHGKVQRNLDLRQPDSLNSERPNVQTMWRDYMCSLEKSPKLKIHSLQGNGRRLFDDAFRNPNVQWVFWGCYLSVFIFQDVFIFIGKATPKLWASVVCPHLPHISWREREKKYRCNYAVI